MKDKVDNVDVGVVVGRFQTHMLTAGQEDLIKSVIAKHPRVIVFLGNSPLRNTLKNPLDFRDRRAIFTEVFPNIEVHYINDCRENEDWSKNLDRQIAQLLLPIQTVILYGSRDCFIKEYKGKYPTVELEPTIFVSATEVRRQVANFYPPTKDYRAGKIAATANRYPICYQTVDVGVVRRDDNKVEGLFARKPNEKLYRFIGGFSDSESMSLEEDARREVFEEANGIAIGDAKYVGSMLINDWRYADEVDKIKTALFVCDYVYGRPEGADDVAEVKWFDLKTINDEDIVEEHRGLLQMFLVYLKLKKLKKTEEKD